jgi:hypothetical protein
MATIRRTESGFFEAQVRKKGFKTLTKTFKTKTEAQKWARMVEADLEAVLYGNLEPIRNKMLADVIDSYIEFWSRSSIVDAISLGSHLLNPGLLSKDRG